MVDKTYGSPKKRNTVLMENNNEYKWNIFTLINPQIKLMQVTIFITCVVIAMLNTGFRNA